jgi:hypothetical protein
LAALTIFVSGCSFDSTLERDVVDNAFEESVLAISVMLGDRDHGVEDAYEWHNDGACSMHRHARWERTSYGDARVALHLFADTASTAGIMTGTYGDSTESPGVSLMAYHWAGDGIDTGYVFSAFAEDAKAVAIRNAFRMSIADERTPAHLLPEDSRGWVYIDVLDNTQCVRPARCGLRPPLNEEERVAIWLDCGRS